MLVKLSQMVTTSVKPAKIEVSSSGELSESLETQPYTQNKMTKEKDVIFK